MNEKMLMGRGFLCRPDRPVRWVPGYCRG